MWCPRCGSSQRDYSAALRRSRWWRTRDVLEELTFCKECGANLYAVRHLLDKAEKSTKVLTGPRPQGPRLLQSSEEAVRRQQALEFASGLTPEVKRYNDIRSGIITGSVGVAMMIFLYVFIQGIIISGKVPNDTAEILSRIWVAGLIPVFAGLARVFNGLFISNKVLARSKRAPNATSKLTGDETPALRSANTAEFLPANFSVTENTTRHLKVK